MRQRGALAAGHRGCRSQPEPGSLLCHLGTRDSRQMLAQEMLGLELEHARGP